MTQNTPQDTSQQLTPENFKSRIVSKYPNGVASDGTPYSQIDATDLTKRMVSKYPDGVTNDGHKYSDFLPPVQQTPAPAPQSFLSKVGNGAIGLLNDIEKPFIGLASTPVQLLAKITGQPDPFKEHPIPGFNGTTVPSSELGVEQKLGDAAQVGSYFLPGEGVAGAIGMGALQGAGSAMSRGGDVADVATQGALGGAIGGVAAGATKAVGGLIKSVGGALSGKTAQEAIQGIKDAYTSALNLGVGERAFEQRSGKDIAQVLLENKAPLGRYENGTLDASTAIDKLQTALNPLNEKATEILSNPQGVVKNILPEDILSSIEKRISSSKVPASQAKTMIAQAKAFIQDEVEKNGGEWTPEVADSIKQGFQNSVFKKAITPEGKLTNNVQYLLSDELKTATEKAVAGTDTETSLKALNAQRSDYIDAIKRLTGMDGVKLLKGGRLGIGTGKILGTMIGATSGNPLTALAGDYFGGKVAEFLQNPATKIATAEAKAKAAGLIPKVLGGASKPVGNAISKVGGIIGKGARAAGLIGNITTNR